MVRLSKTHQVEATCEVCGTQWCTIPSLMTRSCSRECGAKLNPASSRDESMWHVVQCYVCNKDIKKRKKHTGKHSFCGRECLSQGKAELHQTHQIKSNIARGIKRGFYLTADGRSIKYDSSYELRRMQEYDYLFDDQLESWGRCQFTIPYVDSEGKRRNYNPDFELRLQDGSILIEEVKGIIDDDCVLKHAALTAFCASQNNVRASLFSLPEFENRLEVKTKIYVNDFGTFSRPTWEYVFMSMAHCLAARSTCLRKKVGVVFVDDSMDRAYCFGYNGDEAGGANQCESLEPGKCNCVHAEINALTKNNYDLTGSTCFITTAPCPVCAKVLINRKVKRVIYDNAYRVNHGITLLKKRGIDVIRYKDLTSSINADTLYHGLDEAEAEKLRMLGHT